MAPIAKENPAAALREMKQDWQKNTGRHLEDDLQLPETGLVKKQTVAEKKKQLREATKKL